MQELSAVRIFFVQKIIVDFFVRSIEIRRVNVKRSQPAADPEKRSAVKALILSYLFLSYLIFLRAINGVTMLHFKFLFIFIFLHDAHPCSFVINA